MGGESVEYSRGLGVVGHGGEAGACEFMPTLLVWSRFESIWIREPSSSWFETSKSSSWPNRFLRPIVR